jgi:hypothetical protein
VIRRSSATSSSGVGGESLGRAFAHTLARKEFDQLGSLLDPRIDFRGLTPRRTWEGTGREETVDVVRFWFPDSRTIRDLLRIDDGTFADRGYVRYAFAGDGPEGPFVIEQQAYFTAAAGVIDWMRLLCSGFRSPGPATP